MFSKFTRQFSLNNCPSGWWFQPLWKILVSWDYYSQYMEKMFETTNQSLNVPLFHLLPASISVAIQPPIHASGNQSCSLLLPRYVKAMVPRHATKATIEMFPQQKMVLQWIYMCWIKGDRMVIYTSIWFKWIIWMCLWWSCTNAQRTNCT